MIGGRQSRGGEIIPGFDCSTGQAVGYNWDQWHQLCKGKSMRLYPGYQRVYEPQTSTPIFEIFTEEKIW